MERIEVRVETVDWTMGQHGCFSVTVCEGRRAVVDWGDGHREEVVGRGVPRHFRHCYGARLPIRQYVVAIMSPDDGAIAEYGHGFMDMHTHSVDVSGCPGLRVLHVAGTDSLSLGRRSGIERLTVENVDDGLDVSGCARLRELAISGPVRVLDIRRCNELRVLDCSFGYVRSILWSSASPLQRVVADWRLPACLHPKALERLRRLLQRNGGGLEDGRP